MLVHCCECPVTQVSLAVRLSKDFQESLAGMRILPFMSGACLFRKTATAVHPLALHAPHARCSNSAGTSWYFNSCIAYPGSRFTLTPLTLLHEPAAQTGIFTPCSHVGAV